MASTITAGNATNGLALSCDNTGILELKTGTGSGTTAVTIGTGQEVAVTLGSAAAPSITFSGDTNTGIFSPGADRIGFAEGGVQVGEFDASGNLLVGTTSADSRLRVVGPISNANAGVASFVSSTAADTSSCAASFIKFSNNNTTSQVLIRFGIDNYNNGSGQINANGSNAAAFGSFSDRRLKENIVDLPPQLPNIMALRPVEFDYIESEGGGHQTGFIAQEMQEVYPDAVGERAPDGMLTVTGWSKTEARLVKAIQEQQAMIEELKAKVAALEAK
jgi:hypothetical protein